jgi:hypothetical protein
MRVRVASCSALPLVIRPFARFSRYRRPVTDRSEAGTADDEALLPVGLGIEQCLDGRAVRHGDERLVVPVDGLGPGGDRLTGGGFEDVGGIPSVEAGEVERRRSEIAGELEGNDVGQAAITAPSRSSAAALTVAGSKAASSSTASSAAELSPAAPDSPPPQRPQAGHRTDAAYAAPPAAPAKTRAMKTG